MPRASELLMMGRLLVTPQPHKIYNEETNSGCALGMIMKAGGFSTDIVTFGKYGALEWMAVCEDAPCDCYPKRLRNRPVVNIVTHLFDHHICGCGLPFQEVWTIEQLADWLEKVEPKDTPAPENESLTEAATADTIAAVVNPIE